LPGSVTQVPLPSMRAGSQVPPGVAPEAVTPRGLILKLRSTVGTCLSCMVKRGKPLGRLAVASQLDALNLRFGVRAARPLLHRSTPGSPGRNPRARSKELATRFPRRAQRAPAGAELPDLSGALPRS